MTMNQVHRLTGLLRWLNVELAYADQILIEAGLAPEELRHLCSAHLEMFEGELERIGADLKPGHVIHTLVREHDMILSFLDELDKVNHAIGRMESYGRGRDEFDELMPIAEHLLEAELHHRREEEVLFLEVERRGVFGPPQVMRMEHEELRARKRELEELAERIDQMAFDAFKERLEAVVNFIVPMLRDHIFKENNILYPTALQVIQDEEVWERMRLKCDEIGYCCFTPAVEGR